VTKDEHMADAPIKLHFVLADTLATYLSLIYENEHRPYRKRVVTIELTPEQMEAIAPRSVGWCDGTERYEELLDVILEMPESD